MLGQLLFVLVMITIGLSIVVDFVIFVIFGGNNCIFGDFWGVLVVHVGGVMFSWVRIWIVVVIVLVLVVYFVFDCFSCYGFVMRVIVFD